MFNVETIEIKRFAVSSLGAIAMSAACLFAAAGPARADRISPSLTVADWQDKVTNRVEMFQEASTVYQPAELTTAEVAVRFTADGDFAGAVIARSSGDRRVDERAVNVARNIRYPALPAGLHGSPATVRIVLYFGGGADAAAKFARLQDQAAKQVQIAHAGSGAGVQIAAR